MNELMEAVQEARCSQTGGRCYEAMPSAKHPQCAIAAVLQALPNSKLAKRTVARALCDAWFPKGAPFITSDMNVWYQDSQVILSALAELVKDD